MSYATLAFGSTVEARTTGHKNLWAALFLAPVAMAIFSIVLSAQFPVFASAMALVGLE